MNSGNMKMKVMLLVFLVLAVILILGSHMLTDGFRNRYQFHNVLYDNLISYSVSSKDFEKNGLEYFLFLKTLAEELEQLVIFKNWKLRLYHDGVAETVNALNQLLSSGNIQLYDVHNEPLTFENHDYSSVLSLGDSTVEVICHREKGFKMTLQEAIAIKRWLRTNKLLLVLRDQDKNVRVWCCQNRRNLEKARKAKLLISNSRKNSKEAYTLLPNEIWDVFEQKNETMFDIILVGEPFKVYTCNGKPEDERIYQHTYCNSDTLQPHQKVISYSLFGNGTRWNEGGLKYRNSIKTILEQKNNLTLYKDWIVRVYHDGGTNAMQTRMAFRDRPDIQFCNVRCLKQVPQIINILGTFYRTVALGDPNVDISCYRDLDSELTTRETAAVSKWLESGKAIHLMRDHIWHDIIMLGGMWCFRNKEHRKKGHAILQQIIEQGQTYTGRNDQAILNNVFWKHFKVLEDTIQHDSYMCRTFPGTIPFPTKREDINYFVGCDEIPCRKYKLDPCPTECRPALHKNWTYC